MQEDTIIQKTLFAIGNENDEQTINNEQSINQFVGPLKPC